MARAMSAQDTLSVSEAVSIVHGTVASIPALTVVGEVSGFRGPNARSGHCYFELKDEQASMSTIVWRGIYANCGFVLKDGLKIQMTGSFDVYRPSGRLSFKAQSITLQGEGLLRQQVAELARRLEREGLMDPARKRPIPRFCTRVAVVTSLSGSVIDDVTRTLARRNPLVEVLEAPCAVQGAGASATIIRALGVAAAAKPDVILLVRGGGSFEDLMCFNDEALARAVASCPIPVVTGIGHEPDNSICDMVSDRRQSTPSTAAESVALPLDELVSTINERERRLCAVLERRVSDERAVLDVDGRVMEQAIRTQLDACRSYLGSLGARPCLTSPLGALQERAESLDLTEERLHATLPRAISRRVGELDGQARRLELLSARMLRPFEERLVRSTSTLEALSPLKVLSRGYSIVRERLSGRVVLDASTLGAGDEIDVLLKTGELSATVSSVRSAR